MLFDVSVGFELVNELFFGKHFIVSAEIPLFSVISSVITFGFAFNFGFDEFGGA